MEAASIAHAEHHMGRRRPISSSRVNAPTLGMMLFIISEIMIFGAFFTAYFFIRIVTHDPWPAHRHEAARGGRRRQHRHPAVLVADDPLGDRVGQERQPQRPEGRHARRPSCSVSTFLTIQINEYIHIGFSPRYSAQASVFYALTGLHGAHVFIGLCILLTVTIRSFRGHYSPEHHRGMEVPSIYWHFVDIMWVIVYTTVYVL